MAGFTQLREDALAVLAVAEQIAERAPARWAALPPEVRTAFAIVVLQRAMEERRNVSEANPSEGF